MVPPAERGATRIADRVVAKIAAQAAREALHEVWRRPGPSLGTRGVPHGHDCAPHAAVTRRRPADGDEQPEEARIRVAVELGYPSDIGAQCQAVRRHVAVRVKELAGMEVPDVAVEVERLHSAQLHREDLGRVR